MANSTLTRGDLAPLIRQGTYTGLFTGKTFNSIIMTLGQRISVGNKETKIPAWGQDPVAEFVEKTGTQATPVAGTYPAVPVVDAPDIGWKPVSKPDLKEYYLIIEKIAGIVKWSDCAMEDVETPEQLRAMIVSAMERAIARRFDQAAILGTNPPASWVNAGTATNGIIPTAIAEGNVVTAAGVTITDNITALNTAFTMVENADYEVTGIAASTSFMGTFRTITTATNLNIVITKDELTQKPVYIYSGISLTKAQVLKGTNYGAIVGDWDHVIWGARSAYEITYSNQASITDADGDLTNLFQQDQTAVRVVARLGYVVVDNEDGYPLAVIQNAGTTGASITVPEV